ncbi:MAG: FG-GAP repeat protein, partial [Bythopirellula sp.]
MKATTAIAFFSGVALATGLWVAPTSANPLVTETIVEASDADLDDRLGQAVSIDGNIGIIGANRNNDAGPNSGAAYLFDAQTGAELHKLTAADAEERDIFGHSVGISGNTAIVSAQSSDDDGDRSGSAYLFDVTTGQELFKLTASDAAESDFFGHGIGISGNVAIVGAHGDDDSGGTSGSAYLFDVTTGNELRKLTASDGAAGDQFGYWAAIDGNVAIVGAKYDDHAGFRSGSAYLFDVTTGEELFKLTASDAEAGDQFGYAVAIEGNTAVVGAWLNNDAGFDSGSVYVFDVTTGNERLKITASDASALDYFGYAFDISDNTLLVGAYGDDGDSPDAGSAYLYDLTFG